MEIVRSSRQDRVTTLASNVVLPCLCALWILMPGFIQLSTATDDDVSPRLSFLYGAEGRTVSEFAVDGVTNYSSLLMSPSDQRLYVGARETLFSLSLSNITSATQRKTLTWSTPDMKRKECGFKGRDLQTDCFNYIKILLHINSTHLFVCGTYAFSPACAYVNISSFTLERDSEGRVVLEDGRGRCPFNPEHRSTAIIVDGELYTGTVSNFQGNEPTIYKSLGPGPALKTENSLNWLQDPVFVGSAYIGDGVSEMSPENKDEQIYFFFSEMGTEFDFFDNTVVSRIARVCKEDQGGERVLQKKWTTFLKAQLQCLPPDHGFPFNIIQDVFVLRAQGTEQTVFYAVFTSQWSKGTSRSSAVCVFSMEQVEQAFNGRYKGVNRETQQWYTNTQPIPEPRPGMCITNTSRRLGIRSSLDMPDKVLNFAKDHFLMESVIRGHPLLFTHHARYTQIAVHRIQALHKSYDVMFIGTVEGRLQKAVSVDGRMHIIEEISIFQQPQAVQHIELDSTRGLVFVSSHSAVVQLPVANCSFYSNCGDCILARDPHCAWAGTRCADLTRTTPQSQWQQDVEEADTFSRCNKTTAKPSAEVVSECQLITLPPNTLHLLPCKLRSNHASRKWSYSLSPGHFLLPGPEGGLVIGVRAGSEENFTCWSFESGFQQLVANYCVRAESQAESTTLIGGLQVPLLQETPDVLSNASSHFTRPSLKTYRTELAVVCVLLCVCLLLFGTVTACRRYGRTRDAPPGVASQGTWRIMGKRAESSPPNGTVSTSLPSDSKGYHALVGPCAWCLRRETTAPPALALSPARPLGPQADTATHAHAEINDCFPFPRVRLGSEIRDSVI